MPVASLIDDRVFVTHGGISDITDLNKINRIKRNKVRIYKTLFLRNEVFHTFLYLSMFRS